MEKAEEVEKFDALANSDDNLAKINEKISEDFGVGSAYNFSRGGFEREVENPWKVGQFNLTRQSEIFKADPLLAKKLFSEAK